MVRGAYFDCFSGASGDMLLGALLDAGVEPEQLRAGLASLPVGGWALDVAAASQHGLAGTRVTVRLQATDVPHRGLRDVEAIVRGGDLPAEVVDHAVLVFRRLAEVEASIHGTSVDDVEFHEVGAVDAIVDVVGVNLGLRLLGADEVRCSGLPLGSGWVRSAHGRLPVPAPATVALMRQSGARSRRVPSDDETGELTTPTGAALLTTLAQFDEPVFDRIEGVGYGFGSRNLPWPNAVRLLVGEVALAALGAQAAAAVSHTGLVREAVVEIETNLDDSTPEELGFAMEQLLAAGALDVAFSPLQMKKNRPGVLLRVLARPTDATRLAELVLVHTSALGVRFGALDRLITVRSEVTVETAWAPVRVKVKHLGERRIGAPEYEDCARIAREHGVPLRAVFAVAQRAFDAGSR
jgi:uncharacterized protein (TIGR00299 family) protein